MKASGKVSCRQDFELDAADMKAALSEFLKSRGFEIRPSDRFDVFLRTDLVTRPLTGAKVEISSEKVT